MVVTGVITILALPVIILYLLHGFHIAHIFLHIGGITLAIFITILATLAYTKLKTKRLLLSTIAFGNFIGAEITLLIDATWSNVLLLIEEIPRLKTFDQVASD